MRGAPLEHRADEEAQAFRRLQRRLGRVWRAIEDKDPEPHTSIIVPSQSFDLEELAKIEGIPFYEERLLFSLIRLRDPRARVLYLTSQPVHEDIVDYYLHLLAGVPARQARERLKLLCVQDAAPKPLTEKILERPRVIARIKEWMGDPELAYLTCFVSTSAERRLSLALGIPLNGVDPDLRELGTKSGARRVFAEADVDRPLGFEDLRTADDLVRSLGELKRSRPGLARAVVKLNESFAGAGNALYTFPLAAPHGEVSAEAVRGALDHLQWTSPSDDLRRYLDKLGELGGVVEELVVGDEVTSPSVQLRITPEGEPVLLSTHEQVLGGLTGQSYQGCRFPAPGEYRSLIQRQAMRIGQVLARRGVIGRFGIDFLLTRRAGTREWASQAIEINLRMGGTTPPFLALQFLTGGRLDTDSGHFVSSRGTRKFYFATDNLRSPTYRGLLPEDLMDILIYHRLIFQPSTETGVIFHMIGALSQFGKVGLVSIGDSREEADWLYRRTVAILDAETAGSETAEQFRVGDHGVVPME